MQINIVLKNIKKLITINGFVINVKDNLKVAKKQKDAKVVDFIYAGDVYDFYKTLKTAIFSKGLNFTFSDFFFFPRRVHL